MFVLFFSYSTLLKFGELATELLDGIFELRNFFV